MGAIIEVKYYNSFWLKKVKNIVDSTPANLAATADGQSVTTINVADTSTLKTGLLVVNLDNPFIVSNVYITEIVNSTSFKVNKIVNITNTDELKFGPFVNFNDFPKQFIDDTHDDSGDWYLEESRIRGGYNNTSVDFGVKAHAVDVVKEGETRVNALIYSGIYNSRTGINQSNVFSVAEDITKSVDPVNGSIQKLYAEDSNLIIFQENKVSRALIDKDAIYSAEGGGSVTTANLVIGQIVPYAGNYGISTNPESFAAYGYRKYFVDANRNAVMRLSQDGLTEISSNGMTDYFRDELALLNGDKALGAWDIHTKQYVVSLQGPNITEGYQTLSFDEAVRGWTSRFTYAPEQAFSIKNKYYSIKEGRIYEHNYLISGGNNRSRFYGVYSNSSVTFVLNPKVSVSKVFKTVNYEGSSGWEVSSFEAQGQFTNADTSKKIHSFDEGVYTQNGIKYYAGFHNKEGKYKANIVNNSGASAGEVLFGKSVSGVKGYYATATIKTDDSTETNNNGGKPRELFAVSSDYIESSY